uniref:Opioid growth factor receptor-like 1 n=1 Tax=Gouania willdenowi TaxID=441366 RepID=A0A8C5EFJ6_GOUWI
MFCTSHQEFQNTREAKRRFLAAYSLMLDFYGVKLLDKSGGVARAPNWLERFQHLNESHHNYLRITRILKSLGELGYEAFKAPLVHLFLEESLCHGTLPNMQHSILEYYVYTIRQPATRRRLLRFARQHYKPRHAFLWGPPSKRHGSNQSVGGNPGAGSSGIRANNLSNPVQISSYRRKSETVPPHILYGCAVMQTFFFVGVRRLLLPVGGLGIKSRNQNIKLPGELES